MDFDMLIFLVIICQYSMHYIKSWDTSIKHIINVLYLWYKFV
jgi:hypothetical protein